MDPRRRVTGALAPLVLLLPAACAEAPKPVMIGAQPITTFELAPRAPEPVLHKVVLRRITWSECSASGRRRRPPKECAPKPAPTMAVAQSAGAVSAPRLISAVYVRPAVPAPVLPARTPVVYAKPSAPVFKAAEPIPRDHMDGAIRVLTYEPGRVFAVAAAPLRVTTLTLQAGEALVDKAAGDTVRWEIGETTSGSGSAMRTLVMLKPLTAGLSTNMVLTTSQRVYLIDLTSSAKHADRAIAWSYPPPLADIIAAPKADLHASSEPATTPNATATRYCIAPQGRRPSWTPQLVFDDGRHTFIVFGPGLDRRPSPLLFVTDGGGAPALVNYRQEGDLYVVDRLIDRGELRLGGDRAEIVRFARVGEPS